MITISCDISKIEAEQVLKKVLEYGYSETRFTGFLEGR